MHITQHGSIVNYEPNSFKLPPINCQSNSEKHVVKSTGNDLIGVGPRYNTNLSQRQLFRSVPPTPQTFTLTDMIGAEITPPSPVKARKVGLSGSSSSEFAKRFMTKPSRQPKVVEFNIGKLNTEKRRRGTSGFFPSVKIRQSAKSHSSAGQKEEKAPIEDTNNALNCPVRVNGFGQDLNKHNTGSLTREQGKPCIGGWQKSPRDDPTQELRVNGQETKRNIDLYLYQKNLNSSRRARVKSASSLSSQRTLYMCWENIELANGSINKESNSKDATQLPKATELDDIHEKRCANGHVYVIVPNDGGGVAPQTYGRFSPNWLTRESYTNYKLRQLRQSTASFDQLSTNLKLVPTTFTEVQPKSASRSISRASKQSLPLPIRRTPESIRTAPPIPDNIIVYPETFECDDLSYLPPPKRILPKRDVPWVFRYKVKRNMNELSKILASKPQQVDGQ